MPKLPKPTQPQSRTSDPASTVTPAVSHTKGCFHPPERTNQQPNSTPTPHFLFSLPPLPLVYPPPFSLLTSPIPYSCIPPTPPPPPPPSCPTQPGITANKPISSSPIIPLRHLRLRRRRSSPRRAGRTISPSSAAGAEIRAGPRPVCWGAPRRCGGAAGEGLAGVVGVASWLERRGGEGAWAGGIVAAVGVGGCCCWCR